MAPIRYTLADCEPGRWIRFTFSGPRGSRGFHEFTVREDGQYGTVITHLTLLRPRGRALLSFPLPYRPLHDALLVDALDRVELALSGTVPGGAAWSRYVHMLRMDPRAHAAGAEAVMPGAEAAGRSR